MATKNYGLPRCSPSRSAWWNSKTIAATLLALMLCSTSGFAQDQNPQGRVLGDYVVQQSIEVGGRVTDANGNSDVYKTFVNLQDGMRLLDYSLMMRSMSHTATFFDTLFIDGYGFGGDPYNVSRIRMSKNKWYDFGGTFRRDVNFFDFNTLANPWNPANPYAPNAVSPHAMNTRRKMGDFNLTLAPQSPVQVRLGYFRSVADGPSYTTYHEGTDIRLNQDYRNRGDRYQAGADWKFAPRSQVSYDFFFDHNKIDTSWSDQSLGQPPSLGFANDVLIPFRTTDGTTDVPVDFGAIYDPLQSQPCANPIVATPAGGVATATYIKPECQSYRYYSRFGPSRANFRTHQLTFISNYWKNLEMTLSGSYSSGDNSMTNFLEQGQTYISRTNEVGFQFTGPSKVRRISSSVDLGLTYHFNDAWSLSNQFRWYAYRLPGAWASSETACYASLPIAPTGPGANPPGPYAGVLTPPGIGVPGDANCFGFAGLPYSGLSIRTSTDASANPDQLNEFYFRHNGEDSRYNTTLLHYEQRAWGAHVGFRWGNRLYDYKDMTNSQYWNSPYLVWNSRSVPAAYVTVPGTYPAGVAVPGDLAETKTEQTEQAVLAGIRITPVQAWRITADFENAYVDNPFTRISPKHQTRFKARTSYRLWSKLTLGAAVNLREGTNNELTGFPNGIADRRHVDHSRAYNLNAAWTAAKWMTLDLGYTHNDYLVRTSSCMPISSRPTVIPIEGGAIPFCVNSAGAAANGVLPVRLDYGDISDTGYLNLMLKPVNRLAVVLGYDITSTDGSLSWLRADTLAPLRVDESRVTVGGTAGTYVTGPNPRVQNSVLAYNYHKPSASVAYELAKGWTLKGQYNYYDYNEKTSPLGGATILLPDGSYIGVAPRDFHANVGTMSIRYQF